MLCFGHLGRGSQVGTTETRRALFCGRIALETMKEAYWNTFCVRARRGAAAGARRPASAWRAPARRAALRTARETRATCATDAPDIFCAFWCAGGRARPHATARAPPSAFLSAMGGARCGACGDRRRARAPKLWHTIRKRNFSAATCRKSAVVVVKFDRYTMVFTP